MMGGRSVAFVIACWLAAGCELTHLAAETSALACSDGLENDGDGVRDCDDSDCWAFARCRKVAPTGGAPSAPPPELPGEEPPSFGEPQPPVATDAAVTPAVDASIEVDAAILDGGGGGGTAPPPPCVCPGGTCEGDVCVPDAVAQYRVVNLRVVVPRSKSDTVVDECFDDSNACSIFLLCCNPDPVLTMFVDGVAVISLTAQNTVDKLWAEPDIEVELKVGSKIEFDLHDDDTMDAVTDVDGDDAVFQCWTLAEAEHLGASTPITCVPEQELSSPSELPVGVTARLVKKPATAP